MLDAQTLSEEYIKCYMDKSRIYMITHYLKTYDGTQGKEVDFGLFPRQQLLCKALGDGQHSVVTTKSRQSGISTVAAAYTCCEAVMADDGSPKNTLIIGNTLEIAQQMFLKVYDFLMQIPLWMWGHTEEFINAGYDISKPPINDNVIFDKRNQKEMFLKNGCKIYARSSDIQASRGLTVHFLVFDEVAFIENAKEVYTAALPTISATKGRCLFISTPNGKDQLYYETCKRAKLKGTRDWNGFDLVEMHWYQDPRYNKHLEWIKKNDTTGDYDIEKEPILDDTGTIEYNEEKWEKRIKDGWTPRSPWYVKMCQQFNNDPQKIAQELDASFLGSDSTVIEPQYIEMQRELNVREPNPNLKDPGVEDTWVWKPPYEKHRYIMAIDNSRGSSDDATALEIIDLDGIDDNGMPCIEQVLEYNGKLTGDIVGELAYSYGVQYNNAFIIVEDIGGYGAATLMILQRLGYKNLYYDDPMLKKYTNQNDATSTKVTEQGLPGYHTTSLRYNMLSEFANLVRTNQFKIRSSRVCNELDTWVFVQGSRGMDHKDGCHDDTITCLAMGLFVMQHSVNKLIEQKNRDMAMLNAMVKANSRIVQTQTQKREKQEETNNRLRVEDVMFTNKTIEKKNHPNMWLFRGASTKKTYF